MSRTRCWSGKNGPPRGAGVEAGPESPVGATRQPPIRARGSSIWMVLPIDEVQSEPQKVAQPSSHSAVMTS